MLHKRLTKFESDALEMFCEIDKRLRQHLLETLEVAELQRQNLVSTYVLSFHTAHTAVRTTPDVYPVDIAVYHDRPERHPIYYHGCIPCGYPVGANTTCFMLFFIDGHIFELEAYSICCKPIDYTTACTGERTYFIHEEFPMFWLPDQNENSK